jgi:drug/metabolite transporter (DMT)-like permease
MSYSLISKSAGVVFGLLCLIWGSTWLVIKIGLDYLPPLIFAGIRFTAATMVLLLLTKVLHARMPRDRSSWETMLFLGIFQITVPYGLVFWGEQYISSGLSAVLFATLPFFVVIFAHLMINEKLTKLKALGVIASFGGLSAIFWRDLLTMQSLGTGNSLLGGLAVVGSAASGALANVVAKRYSTEIHPAANVLVQMTMGSLILLLIGLTTESGLPIVFSWQAIASILYLGVVGSALAFIGLYWLLTKISATNSSLITFVTPILALILGWAILQEVPDISIALGTGLILAGVYLTMKPSR